jgi:hypothetical protein
LHISDDRITAVHQRIVRLSQLSIAFLTIAAWFAISVHCAFGAFLAASKSAALMSARCHESHSTPAKKGSEGEAPCCKVLRATVASPAKVPSLPTKFSIPLPDWSLPELVWHHVHFHRPQMELDTGPPVALSFTESVLQRSILAHAPPCLS